MSAASVESPDGPDLDRFSMVRDALRAFAAERDWNAFHTPKNLAMALAGEVGEVMEHLQWLTPEASLTLDEETRAALALELADVLFYLVRLADVAQIDLAGAATQKLASNAKRYPADKARGRATKYDRL